MKTCSVRGYPVYPRGMSRMFDGEDWWVTWNEYISLLEKVKALKEELDQLKYEGILK